MKLSEMDYAVGGADYAKHRKTVAKILAQRGYKKLGAGVDAMAFGKSDDATVIKIIIPEYGSPDALYRSRNTFAAWMGYSEKNAKNPHLPKFIKLKMQPLILDGEKFELQGMEKLKKMNDLEHNMCLSMVRAQHEKMSFEKFITAYYQKRIKSYKESNAHPNLFMELDRERKKAAEQRLLYDTLVTVEKVGKSLGFSIDFFQNIDSSNLMKRTDGTIVIADPWVA